MDFKQLLKNGFSIVALVITCGSLMATSYGPTALSYGTFDIISDCVSPVLQNTITTSAGVITSPGAVSYTDFGFPVATVEGDEVTGTIGAIMRVCKKTYGDETGSKNWIYSCFDDGQFACTIALTEL